LIARSTLRGCPSLRRKAHLARLEEVSVYHEAVLKYVRL
jgi:hypothetical protein